MGAITDKLIEYAGGEFVKQQEVGDGTGKWSMFNDGGIECETGELMYAFVRELKPEHVLETGTHRGVGASYMGLALQDNGFGQLDTIEFLPEHYNYSKDLINKIGLSDYVKTWHMDVAQFTPPYKYQLMLLDTEPQTRFQELLDFYPYLEDGGYVFIHDLHRHMHQIENKEHGFAWPYGKIPKEMEKLVTSGQLRPFHFGTPRGLTMFYKPTKEDYQWKK